jgi:hypothetical protein
LGCGCVAEIDADDPRAEIWLYVLGRLTFPLRHPLPMNTRQGWRVYEGDAGALTPEQRERLIEKMVEKFKISRAEVERVLDEGSVPIRTEGVVVYWCPWHAREAVL